MKYSRLICLFAVLICFSATCIAQEKRVFQQNWSYGINGGMTSSVVNFAPKIYQARLNQSVGGFSIRYIGEKYFGLHGELNLSQRGWRESKDSIPEHKYTMSLLYAELPLLTHVYFDLGTRVRIIFNLGPQIGYLLSAKEQENQVVLENPNIPEETKPVQYRGDKPQNKFDWGLTGGGGFELRTGIGSFVLEGRYYYGLSDIYKNSPADFYAGSANQVTTVKLTYFFSRKK
jgi:hypothetical protein